MAGTKEGAAKRALLRTSPTQDRTLFDCRYAVGRKPIKIGTKTLSPGDPVPGAENWPRVESWLRTGALVRR